MVDSLITVTQPNLLLMIRY